MALFSDGEVSTIDDLRGYDTQLLDVANTEGIDVTRKLALAREELAADIGTLLGRLSAPPAENMVVVTAPLKLWHLFRTLELVYRDAYHSQLNDRYAAKRDEYRAMAKWAYDKVVQIGLGIANDPVERAGPPEVTPHTGVLADGTYYVAIAWTNQAGAEGMSSTPVAICTLGSSFLVEHGAPPTNVRGWNVYAGSYPQALIRQNESPLDLRAAWVQPDRLVTSGQLAGAGQQADYLLPVPRILQRA